jgi:RNA-directed DNA polymerase
MKQPNKEGLPSAEAVEGRTSPEGNGGKTAAARTLRRDTMSNGLVAVRRAARQSKSAKDHLERLKAQGIEAID